MSNGNLHSEDKKALDEKVILDMIHEVGTSLTVILCYAELLERALKRKAAALTPQQVKEQDLEREQDQVSKIIYQVHSIEHQLMTMADATNPHKQSISSLEPDDSSC